MRSQPFTPAGIFFLQARVRLSSLGQEFLKGGVPCFSESPCEIRARLPEHTHEYQAEWIREVPSLREKDPRQTEAPDPLRRSRPPHSFPASHPQQGRPGVTSLTAPVMGVSLMTSGLLQEFRRVSVVVEIVTRKSFRTLISSCNYFIYLYFVLQDEQYLNKYEY